MEESNYKSLMKQLNMKSKKNQEYSNDVGMNHLEKELDEIIIFDKDDSIDIKEGEELIKNLQDKQNEYLEDSNDKFQDKNFKQAVFPKKKEETQENDFSRVLDEINDTERNHKQTSSFKKGIKRKLSKISNKTNKSIDMNKEAKRKREKSLKMKIESPKKNGTDILIENQRNKIIQTGNEKNDNQFIEKIRGKSKPTKKEQKKKIKKDKALQNDIGKESEIKQDATMLDSINDYNAGLDDLELIESEKKQNEDKKIESDLFKKNKMTTEEIAKYFADSLRKKKPITRKKKQESFEIEYVTETVKSTYQPGFRYSKRMRYPRLLSHLNEGFEYDKKENRFIVKTVRMRRNPTKKLKRVKKSDMKLINNIRTEVKKKTKDTKEWKMYFKKDDFKELSKLESNVKFKVSCTEKLRTREFFEIFHGINSDELEKKILRGDEEFTLQKNVFYFIRNISCKSSNLVLSFSRRDD